MPEENVEIVRRVTGALQAGLERYGLGPDVDVEALAPDFDSVPVAEDVEIIPARELATGRESYSGLAGFVEFLRIWTEDFEDWSVEYQRFIEASEDRVVALAHQSATGKGSGIPVELDFGVVFELEDRQVVRIRIFLDPAEALAIAQP